MNQAKYPSKERVVRDDVLVYAEGDDLLNDPDEARRQGYKIDPAGTEVEATAAPAEADEKPAPKKRTTRKTAKKA